MYAKKYGVPPGLARALIGQESGGNDKAHNPSGAHGRMQIHLPSHPEVTRAQAEDPDFAMDWGFRYLSEQKKRFGSWRLALAAYNAGPGAVEQYGGIPPYAETQNYVKSILRAAGAFKGGDASEPGLPRDSVTAGAPAPVLGNRVQGLQALMSGTYNPTEQLQGLLEQRTSGGAGNTNPSPGEQGQAPLPPVAVEGKPTKKDAAAVALIHEYLGTPYSWGGGGPEGPSRGIGRGANTVGFDCSSLLQFVWAKQGVQIPRVTYDQWNAGNSVPKSRLRPGDAVFFRPGSRGPEHVGMYIGGGKFIEAPRTGLNVRISKLADRKDYIGARRYGG